MKYGLIGMPLGHSFSGEIHARFADYAYDLRELAPEELPAFFAERAFAGINVTIPYKQAVIPYLDEIAPEAREIGAVNTIVHRDGHLYGANTDFFGLRALLERSRISLTGKNVLILGTGGTAKTAAAVARAMGAARCSRVSRTPQENDLSYAQALEKSDTHVILNTTPRGMYPNISESPIALDAFPALTGVVDAIYNPLRSTLVLDAQSRGIPAVGGLYMLVAQAVQSSELFCGHSYAPDTAERVYRELYAAKRNIVLIGMPGCGKSTVGRVLAAQIGRRFVDLDHMIAAQGRTPAQIIRTDGERAFRAIETDAVRTLAPEQGLVIATGGGTVLSAENRRLLAYNGVSVFLDRPLNRIRPTASRPLSSDRAQLEARYRERAPIYRTADIHLRCPESVDETVARVRACLDAFGEGGFVR